MAKGKKMNKVVLSTKVTTKRLKSGGDSSSCNFAR